MKGNEPAFSNPFNLGLTKREYIATAMLQGILTHSYNRCRPSEKDVVAHEAAQYANALIEVLNKLEEK